MTNSSTETRSDSTTRTEPSESGRYHVCPACDWIGDGHAAECAIVDGVPGFRCPECSTPTEREYFGSPLPDEGTIKQTPYGLDSCPVCRTAGIFVSDQPSTCLCGAELSGLSTTEIVTVPDRGERDVIIRAPERDLRHKVFDYMDLANNDIHPRQSLAYWRVNGTPQRTGPGRVIMFSTGGETVDFFAPICTAEEGRIWFDFLSPTNFEVPAEPPTRGFKYVDWGDWPW